MQLFPPTIVLRHRRENLKKCSLRGLEPRSDCLFYSYPKDVCKLDISHYIVLALEAPPLTIDDAAKGLFILDATWRYASKMLAAVSSNPTLIFRSIPNHFRTAYPRRQEDCSHPEQGLASIEAIYISYLLMKRNTDQLLDSYYWKNQFLEMNNNYIDF